MDRLHALIPPWLVAASVLLGCEGAPPPPPSSARVEAVAAKAPAGDGLDEFCDVHSARGAGPRMELPQLAPPAAGRSQVVPTDARWVNLWATWCKPCTEELPMIAAWQKRLESAGLSASVAFVSLDADDAAIDAFREAHSDAPPSLRAQDPKGLGDWMQGVGLDRGAGLPIHVYADASGHVRCVRAGAITEHHYPVVEKLMR